jgi:hypothetical protein
VERIDKLTELPKNRFTEHLPTAAYSRSPPDIVSYSSPGKGSAAGTLAKAASNFSRLPRAARRANSWLWLDHTATAWAIASEARRSTGTPSVSAKAEMDLNTGEGTSAVIALITVKIA